MPYSTRYKKRIQKDLCGNCGSRPKIKDKSKCSICLNKQVVYKVEERRRLRVKVLKGYGGFCTCCLERDFRFLTIDHVNNDGHADRYVDSAQFYRVILKENFPPRYQILCFNCNCGRAKNGGICPHRDFLPRTEMMGQVENREVH